MATPSIAGQLMALEKLSIAQLRQKWWQVFETEPRSRDRGYLFRKLAHRIQELQYGELEQEVVCSRPTTGAKPTTRKRNKTQQQPAVPLRDARLPMPGTVVTCRYKGHNLTLRVLDKGFEFQGRMFRSLSAVAREITGTSWNGFLFWGLTKGGRS